MSFKNFFLAWFICAGIFLAVDLLWHLVIFNNFYTTVQSTLGHHSINYLYLVVGDVYRGLIFGLVYTLFVRKHRSPLQGVFFGICVGLLLSSVSALYYSLLKINVIQWLWYESGSLLIQCTIAGLLVSIICWRKRVPKENP